MYAIRSYYEYIVTYTVSDNSGNKTLITRKVIVTEKPKVIIQKSYNFV